MTEVTSLLETEFDTPNEKGSSEPIPAGQYVASVFDVTVSPLKSKKGQGVNLTWEIDDNDPKYAGRRIFDLVIVSHENEDAMRIGRGKLKDILAAVGVTEAVKDLSVLCHKPVWVQVKIEEDKTGQYPDKNRIGKVKPISAAKKKTNGATKEEGTPFNDEVKF